MIYSHSVFGKLFLHYIYWAETFMQSKDKINKGGTNYFTYEKSKLQHF